MKKIVALLLAVQVLSSKAVTSAVYNKELNCVEFVTTAPVENQKSSGQVSGAACKIFTPLAPYNAVTCVITGPATVALGQTFTIDFAITAKRFTYISFWADLLPSGQELLSQGLRIMEVRQPLLGIFDDQTDSMMKRGGKGVWHFPDGIPAGTHHMTIVLKATSPGTKSMTTVLATNPPSFIKVLEITVEPKRDYEEYDETF